MINHHFPSQSCEDCVIKYRKMEHYCQNFHLHVQEPETREVRMKLIKSTTYWSYSVEILPPKVKIIINEQYT